MKAIKKQRDADIARMLADGHAVPVIAKETGATERTIYRRKAAMRKDAGDAAVMEVQPGIGQPASAIPAALTKERLIGMAYAVGLSRAEIAAGLGIEEADVDIDVTAQETALSGRVQALARLRAEKPDKWLLLMERREAEERRQAESKAIPFERFRDWMGHIIAHQQAILTEDDMRQWVSWLEDLATNQFPECL